MTARSFAVLARLSAAVMLVPVATACSDDETDPTSALVGTWNATHFTGLGNDFIAAGMVLRLVLTSSHTYTITFTNDLIGACDGGVPNCTQTGDYESTATTITINPGDPEGETVFTWTIQGTTMTWTGSIDGTAVTIVFARA